METKIKSRAEKIIENDPNGLVVVDKDLNIVEFNKALLNVFEIKIDKKIIGKNINNLLGQKIFMQSDISKEHGSIRHHEVTGKVVKLVTFKIMDEEDLQACFFVDITSHIHNKQKLVSLRNETIEKARLVINRQMSVAQEIAALLGETTADSKTTLIKLIKVLEDESEIYE